MNTQENYHITKTLDSGVRYDGRELKELRNIEVEYNVSATAHGSARVKVGNTEVIAGVKVAVGTPFSDRPNEGVLMVGCELLPIAHPKIEQGPPSITAIEIGRVIDRGIRESGAIDVTKLCIKEGEKVWVVNVDVIPLNHDGNLIDIGAIAAIEALKTVKFPALDENGKADYHNITENKLPVEKLPIAITVGKIGNNLFVDPTKAEEDLLDARLTVTTMEDDKICSLQKGGEVGFSVDEIEEIFNLAVEKAKEIRSKL